MLPASLLELRRSEANRCSRPARTENTDLNATLATPSILRPAGISDVLAARRTGAGEDELADETGVLGHKRLGDEAERLDEGCRVVCHRLDDSVELMNIALSIMIETMLDARRAISMAMPNCIDASKIA